MKKIISLFVIAIIALGLSGCIDSPDDSSGKLPDKKVISDLHL